MTETATQQRGFTLTRTVDASPEQVFRAWTDPAHMAWYLNPEQPTPDEPIEVDLRVGGTWRLMMVISPTTRFTTGGIYLEIEAPNRLVFAMGAVDGWPKLDPDNLEATPIVSLDLQSAGDQTQMTLTTRFPDSMSEDDVAGWLDSGMRDGWSMTIDRVVDMFANMPG